MLIWQFTDLDERLGWPGQEVRTKNLGSECMYPSRVMWGTSLNLSNTNGKSEGDLFHENNTVK